MGLIDWNPQGPPPMNGVGVGLSALDDALNQIMAKRQAEEDAKAKADAALRDKLMVDARERERIDEEKRSHLVNEANAAANQGLQERRFASERYGQAVPLLQQGNATLARPFLQGVNPTPSGQQVVADLLGESAGIAPPGRPAAEAPPPELSRPPPQWSGNGPPPLEAGPSQGVSLTPSQAPAAAPGPSLDLADAMIQRADAERRQRQQADLADWQKARTPGKAATSIEQRAFADTVAAAQGGQLGKETMEQAYARRRHELESEDNALKAASIRAQSYQSPELRNDAANRQDASNLERAVKDLYTAAGGKDQLKGMNTLHAAFANINATGDNAVVAHKDAMIQLAKYFRGNVPTDAEMKALYDKIGGVYGSIDQFVKNVENGDLSDPLMKNIIESARIALGEAEKRRGQLFQAFHDRLGPGTEFENMGPQVNRQVKAYGRLFGLEDVPNIYQEDAGNRGTMLGSGKRPTPGQARPATPTGGRHESEDAADAILRALGRQ